MTIKNRIETVLTEDVSPMMAAFQSGNSDMVTKVVCSEIQKHFPAMSVDEVIADMKLTVKFHTDTVELGATYHKESALIPLGAQIDFWYVPEDDNIGIWFYHYQRHTKIEFNTLPNAVAELAGQITPILEKNIQEAQMSYRKALEEFTRKNADTKSYWRSLERVLGR